MYYTVRGVRVRVAFIYIYCSFVLFSVHAEWSDKISSGIQVRPPSHGSRIVIKLFWDASPLACEVSDVTKKIRESLDSFIRLLQYITYHRMYMYINSSIKNFATLCTNGNNSLKKEKKVKPAPIGDSGKPLTYKNSMIHRLVDKSFVQGGDFVFGNGSGGESIYNGKKFKDERDGLSLQHDRKGIVSMGNSGKNSNTSQFFITFKALPQCDGKHVVFGEVVSGFEALDALASVGIEPGNGDKPMVPIQISDCGTFAPLQTPGSGYWYDQPDPESFSGTTPVFMVRPRVAVVAATKAICAKFVGLLGNSVCATLVPADDLGGDDAALSKVQDLLKSFSVDLAIVAPVYADTFENFKIPTSWLEASSTNGRGASVKKEEVVIISKPVEALRRIHTMSYIGKNPSYRLDGAQ